MTIKDSEFVLHQPPGRHRECDRDGGRAPRERMRGRAVARTAADQIRLVHLTMITRGLPHVSLLAKGTAKLAA